MTVEEKIQLLKDFKPDFSELEAYLNKPNIFRILRLEELEIRHSNFLAWLLDSKANHGLGDKFLCDFLELVIKRNEENIKLSNSSIYNSLNGLKDFGNFKVDREKSLIDSQGNRRYIDLLLVNDTEKIVICIENKVKSFQHDGQLEAYQNFIESKIYKDYSKLFLYLTSTNENINNDKWVQISYEYVLNILENCQNIDKLEPEIKLYINDYIDILRREIMHKDEELQKLVNQIYYSKDKMAFDVIFELTQNPLTEIITNVLDEEEVAGKLYRVRSNVNRKSNTEFRFSTKNLDKLIPPDESRSSEYWKTHHKILYNIIVENKDGHPHQILCTAMLSNLCNDEDKKIWENPKRKLGKNSRVYQRIIPVESSDEFYEKLSEKIKDFIEEDIKEFEKTIQEKQQQSNQQ